MKVKKIPKKKTKSKELADDISCSVGEKRILEAPIEFFPTGSTTLNLTFAGQPDVGWPRARIINVVGDGSSGKTLLTIEAFFNFLKYIPHAKSKLFPKVKKTKAIFNNREGVLDFPLRKMYGNKFVDSIEHRTSRTMENLGNDITRTIDKIRDGTAIIYAVDSWDVFPSMSESKSFEKAVKNDTEMDGSYGGEKNKYTGKLFRELCSRLENNKKDFTLFIISQTRQKIGKSWGDSQYRTGGAPLDFLTHIAVWLKEIEKLTKKKEGEERPYAITSGVKVKRSKVWKPFRMGSFRILYDYGIDDIGGMWTYLRDRKVEKWNDFSLKDPQKFIQYIERKNLEDKLKQDVYHRWLKIEEAFEKEVEVRKKKCL